MDSDDDISEGEILSDDGELTNNADDDYEDGMLLDDDEEGETDTEDSNQSDVTEVGDCEATENHVSHNSRSDWKHNRKRQYTKDIHPSSESSPCKIKKKTFSEEHRQPVEVTPSKCPVIHQTTSASTCEGGDTSAINAPNEKEQDYTCTVLELPKHSMHHLPPGWKILMHDSGLPVFYHKDSGVCTFSRPFVVDKNDNIRAKEPPLASLPCMEYRLYLKAKHTLQKKLEAQPDDQNASKNGSSNTEETGSENRKNDSSGNILGSTRQPTRIEVMKNLPKSVSLEEMQNYIEKLFVVNERRPVSEHKLRGRFARRKMKEKYEKKCERGVALVVKNGDRLENIRLLEANHTNRNYITVLNEYCSKALKTIPVYNCSNVLTSSVPSVQDNSSNTASNESSQSTQNANNSLTQTHCVVSILNVKYGEATAVGKRLAKNLAAKQALKVLCPEVLRSDLAELESDDLITSSLSFKLRIIDIFKSIKIGDPKVIDELKVREANAFAPMHLLNQFLIRNLAPPELKLHTNFETVKDSRSGINCHECELKLGNKYSAKASAKTQNQASQLAALKLLEELHPSLIYYSSLIRLYGIDPTEVQMQKERQIREDVANGGQELSACDTILKLLREEMKKVAAEREHKKQKEATDGLKITAEDPEFFYTKLWQFDNE